MRKFWSLCAGIVGLFSLVLAGCGGDEGFTLAEVSGVVKSKGKALDGIQVEFHPATKGAVGQAVTDKDGRYSFKATVGKNKVVLKDTAHFTGEGGKVGRKYEDVDLSKGKPVRISADLGDVTKTTIDKNVTNGSNTIEIDVP